MLFQPRFKKFKKMHRCNTLNLKNTKINFFSKNSIGLKSVTSGYITTSQIEAARKTITRGIKRIGKLYIHIFPDHSLTARAKESRMGSGKGSVNSWVSVIYANMLLFELTTPLTDSMLGLLKSASKKLPIKTKIINND